ncbi:MAG: hypothetical protein ACPIOQ_54250, partial [Promethearchaeia archaeon]
TDTMLVQTRMAGMAKAVSAHVHMAKAVSAPMCRAFRVSAAARVNGTKTLAQTVTAQMGGGKEHMSHETVVKNAEMNKAAPSSTSVPSLLLSRFTRMVEVTVSKIFPAGFGWQAASAVAGSAGMAPTSLPFFITTGLGDFAGVMGGHVAYMAAKKSAGFKVNLGKEVDTGLWLGSAAFCSGFVWQPTLNACVDLGLTFNQSATGVFSACTLAFFGGLRMFRMLYSPLTSVEPNNYQNLKADAGLAVAVGGATGCFVGTDITFADNWLRPVVGIEDGTSDMVAQVIAGSSTGLGFLAVQSAQNLTLPKGKNWIDPP